MKVDADVLEHLKQNPRRNMDGLIISANPLNYMRHSADWKRQEAEYMARKKCKTGGGKKK